MFLFSSSHQNLPSYCSSSDRKRFISKIEEIQVRSTEKRGGLCVDLQCFIVINNAFPVFFYHSQSSLVNT